MLVLIAGTILTPGRKTVTSALSIMGLREIATFTTFHRVLDRDPVVATQSRVSAATSAR